MNAPHFTQFADLVSAASSLESPAKFLLMDQAEGLIALERAQGAIIDIGSILSEHAWVDELSFRWRFSFMSSATEHAMKIEAHMPGKEDAYGRPTLNAILENAALAARLADGTLTAQDSANTLFQHDAMRAALHKSIHGHGFTGRSAGRFLDSIKKAERELTKALVWATLNAPEWAAAANLRGTQWEKKIHARAPEDIAVALGFPALGAEIERKSIDKASRRAPPGPLRQAL
jgi:hypothetical protein